MHSFFLILPHGTGRRQRRLWHVSWPIASRRSACSFQALIYAQDRFFRTPAKYESTVVEVHLCSSMHSLYVVLSTRPVSAEARACTSYVQGHAHKDHQNIWLKSTTYAIARAQIAPLILRTPDYLPPPGNHGSVPAAVPVGVRTSIRGL